LAFPVFLPGKILQTEWFRDNVTLPKVGGFMSYEEEISKCKNVTELLALWKNKAPVSTSYIADSQETHIVINHKNVFISDGVVDDDAWGNGKKILFLLKEAYGETEDWSLTNWLKAKKPSTSNWKRVIEWTYGIQNTDERSIAKYSPDIFKDHPDLFYQIAVVNLKKSGGKSHSVSEEIAAYALADQAEIRKQLALIGLDIIVCGATFGPLNQIYDGAIRGEGTACDNWFYFTDAIAGKETMVIDYYHPANYWPALVNYYAVTNIYQQALLQHLHDA
jgi:hypothetical protein